MPSTLDELTSNLLALPAESRLELAERLVASVETFISPRIRQAWSEEVASRLAAIERGEVIAIPFDEALEQTRKMLREARTDTSASAK